MLENATEVWRRCGWVELTKAYDVEDVNAMRKALENPFAERFRPYVNMTHLRKGRAEVFCRRTNDGEVGLGSFESVFFTNFSQYPDGSSVSR